MYIHNIFYKVNTYFLFILYDNLRYYKDFYKIFTI